MSAFAGPLFAGAALLVVAGVPKLLRPAATVLALRSVGWRRGGPPFVRALAGLEIVVGTGALLDGGRLWAAAVGICYAGFVGFLVVALRRPAASCGCAGRRDTPPTTGHLVMNVLFVAAAAGAVVGGTDGVLAAAQEGPAAEFVSLLGFVLLTTWLAWVVLAVLPTAQPRAVAQSPGRTG